MRSLLSLYSKNAHLEMAGILYIRYNPTILRQAYR